MKTTKWHFKVVISLLLVAMLLFTGAGVTAFAAYGAGGAVSGNDISYDEPWYSVVYIPASDTNPKPRIDIRIKTDWAEYGQISKDGITAIKDRAYEIVYQIVFDSIMKDTDSATADIGNELEVLLLSDGGAGGNIQLPDNLDHIDINRLEKFIRDHFSAASDDEKAEAKQRIDDYLNGDYDHLISIAVDKYASKDDAHTFDEIFVKADHVFQTVIESVYNDDSTTAAQKTEASTEKIEAIVRDVENIHAEGGELEISIEDAITSLEKVSVDGIVICNDGEIILDAIKDLIRSLPSFEEIEGFDDDEMVLEYDVNAEFIFGEVSFDLSIGFEGDCSAIRAVAGVIADYISYERLPDGTASISVEVPRKFSEAVVKALSKDTVSDELKHKIFALMSKNADEVHAYINDLSFDEIIELLEAVDFESILNSEIIKRHIDLSNLTNEQIVEKVRQYEGYYNKAVRLVAKVMNKLPDSVKSKTLLDIYDGNGRFEAAVDKQDVNLEELMSSVGGRYGKLVSAFLDCKTVDIKAKLTVDFESVNRVTYMLDANTVLSEGFLPEGADVAFFANKQSHNGALITSWVDASGTVYTEMPDSDIVLYAYFGSGLTVSGSGNINKTFNGSISYFNVTAEYSPSVVGAPYSISYAWYKNTVAPENLIAGASAYLYGVRSVADSGTYICVVTVDEAGVITTDSITFTAAIAKKQINVSGVTWSYDATVPFFYDGYRHSVTLIGVPSGVNIYYTDNEFVNAGIYTASATFAEADPANTTLIGSAPELEWEIKKASYDLSGISFDSKIIKYDGNPHQIFLEGNLPDEIQVVYSPAVSAVGFHKMTVSFIVDGNHNEIEPITAVLVILPKDIVGIDFSYTVDGEVVVEITAKDSLGENVTVTVSDLTGNYKNIDFSSIADGKDITLGVAYDISLLKGDKSFSASDNKFTVKLLIPSALRAKENLMVVHIDDEGILNLIDSEREGNYMVFETTHFSVYSIICADESEVNYWWLWLLIAIVVVLAVVVVVLLIIRRNNGEPKEPVDEAPQNQPNPENSEQAPAEEAPAEEAPAEEAPAEEAPSEEAPAEEAPSEEAPAEEAPAEEAPAEEAPAEEAPAEEAPAEEAPAEEAPAVAPITIADDDSIVVDGNIVFIRYRSSFTSRLIQTEEVIQDRYTKLKNYILSFKGIKSRTSFNYEAFNKGKAQAVRLNVKGKALFVNLALNPEEYSASKYHFVDMSGDTKCAGVPMLLKVKSDRSLKYAFELIDEVMKKLGIEQGEIPEVDYHMPYEPNSQLAKRGLVKVILPVGVKLDKNAILREADVSELLSGTAPSEKVDENTVEPVEEAPIEEAPIEEAPTELKMPLINTDDSILVNGQTVSVRYRSSFTSRLIQAETSVQDYYTIIKNYLLSFKGVKSRTSWNYENFTKGRSQCARINVKGKTLTVNLALAPDGYNANKYHFSDVSDDPRFDKLPMLLKVRSARALKYALELIDELMASIGIAQSAVPEVDYHMPYEPNSELAKRGLVKLILPKGVKLSDAATIVETDVSELIAGVAPSAEAQTKELHTVHIVNHHILEEEIVHVDAAHADEIISDEDAEEFIEIIEHEENEKPKSSKCYEINLDVLCSNYKDGDVVTLKSLKEKELISPKAERIKVLARGIMTKKLTVYADKFSMQAVKMIGLAGGVAELYRD